MVRDYSIKTPRLLLHALTRDEMMLLLDQRYQALRDHLQIAIPDEWLYAPLVAHLPEILTEMASLSGDERWAWVIVEASSKTLIGDIGFHQPLTGDVTLEIGYAIVADYQNQGYATEAAQALMQWAFTQPEPQRIIAHILPTNAASIKVAHHLGMHEVQSDEPEYLCFEKTRS